MAALALAQNEGNEAITADIAFVEKTCLKSAIITLSRNYVTVIVMRTPHARIQLRVQYTDNYPTTPLMVDLTSPTLPAALLRNKEKECVALVVDSQGLGKAQMAIVYKHVHQFVHLNLFLPCWKEMKQVANYFSNDQSKGSVAADDKTGVLKIKMAKGNYKLTVWLTVPPAYPCQGVSIAFIDCSYTQDVQHMFLTQAQEIVRRLEAGYALDTARLVSNPIKFTKTSTSTSPSSSSAEPVLKMTTGSLRSLKHDVEVLAEIKTLRVTADGKGGGNKGKYVTEVSSEKRDARKDLRRLAKAEGEADAAEHAGLLILDQEMEMEMEAMLHAKTSESAHPSLWPSVQFIAEDFFFRLQDEKCQACKKCVFPANPSAALPAVQLNLTGPAKSVHDKEARINKPMRTFCGHWLHFQCLDTWLTTPPFIHSCPECDRRIFHPDWPEDHKKLERAWQVAEARRREELDVLNMF